MKSALSPIDDNFVRSNVTSFEDFWNYNLEAEWHTVDYPAYGYRVQVTTNDPRVIEAARLAAPRYSHTAPIAGKPEIQFTALVVPQHPSGPPPVELASNIRTFAAGRFMVQSYPPWLHCFADLTGRQIEMTLAPALADDLRLVSRYCFDRFTNNVLLREGVGQLHATCLVKEERAVLLIAPHGTGKSTTAFHMLDAGYQLLGDSLVFVRWQGEQFELMGYPVGEAKLTPDTLARFPALQGSGEEITVHQVLKNVFDLRALAPELVAERALVPSQIVLCLAERGDSAATNAEMLAAGAALEQLLPNTIYLDDPHAMAASLDCLRRLLVRASCYRLRLGTDPRELVRVIQELAAAA